MNQKVQLLILLFLSVVVTFCIAGPSVSQPVCTPEKLDGTGKINFNELPGKYIYVDFWASWCAPCKQSFPFLNNVTKQFSPKGITVVGINVDKILNDATDFLKINPANFIIARDTDGACAKAMNLKGMPSSYILSKTGEVIYTHKGFHPSDVETITNELKRLDGRE